MVGRWTVGTGWALRLNQSEEVCWVNEGLPPKPADLRPARRSFTRRQGIPAVSCRAELF